MESQIIRPEELSAAEDEAARFERSLIDTLVARGSITEGYFAELLAPRIGVPIVDLERVPLDSSVITEVSEEYAKTNGLVLFEHDQRHQRAKVAMLDPLDYDAIEYLRAKLNAWIEPYLTTPSSLRYGLRAYKEEEMGDDFEVAIKKNVSELMNKQGEEGGDGDESDVAKLAEAVPVVSILDRILEHAISLNASDIHFDVLEDVILVRFRIDGVLRDILRLPKALAPILIARVKVLASLRLDEHRAPQDGRFRAGSEESPIDLRVSILPTMRGEKVVMRLLKSTARAMTFAELGFSQQVIDTIEAEIGKPNGMVLVTGPTGHGKTTTLYSVLHVLNTSEVNIVTIEDPIEYEIPGVNQTQINPKANITFASGLRSILRQNPDIVMVGEIRDEETADISIHASLTGHLVLSTLHTNDAPSALPRFIDMNAEPFLLVSTVNMVLAQRLVKRICTTCVASEPTPDELRELIVAELKRDGALNKEEIEELVPKVLYKGKGCEVCGGSGFRGQIAIAEIMQMTDGIRELVTKKAPAPEIRKQSLKDGMVPMFEDGLKKVEQGITTIHEVMRVVRE